MNTAERSRAPRLTLYNHEEELERLAALDAELKKLSRSACEAAERLAREEAEYEIATEQAWIAAVVEQGLKAAERLVWEEARYASLMSDVDQTWIAEIEHKRLACEDKLLDWSDFDEDKYVKRRKRLIMLKFSMLKKSKLSQEDVDQVMGNNL